jgi:hypothetical protein
VNAAVHELTGEGETVGVISAGWQEAEGDLHEMQELIERPLLDLGLYRRANAVVEASQAVREAHRKRQDRLRLLQRYYRVRLSHAMNAAVAVLESDDEEEVIKLEQRHAIAQLRALDRHHLGRVRAAHAAYDEVQSVHEAEALLDQRREIEELLAPLSTVVITGGNVAVLISRLRLMGMERLLRDKHLVAWSAGAMALCDRIVLYHDRAPQGRRDAEIFDVGLGLVRGLIVLPNARRRLDTGLTTILGLLSRRFAPRRCATLDNASVVRVEDNRVVAATDASRITRKGKLGRLRLL